MIWLESVWILTRERIPDGPVLQAAYGVLDKYKISWATFTYKFQFRSTNFFYINRLCNDNFFSRTFFVKTDQQNCETTADADEAVDAADSGYDVVVDDDTVAEELLNNHGITFFSIGIVT